MMKKILQYIALKPYLKGIDKTDYEHKNKLTLFIAFSITSFILAILVIIQNIEFAGELNIISGFVLILSNIILINFFLLNYHKKLILASIVIIAVGMITVHVVSYYTGGIRNSGMMYYGSLILASFMLLGKKAGKITLILSTLNLIYFYILNTFYNEYIINILDDGTYALIDQDYLLTYSAALILIFALSNNLENTKNNIIQKIKDSLSELEIKNIELSKLSLVAAKIDNAVIITNNQGQIEWVNKGFEKLTGFKTTEAINEKIQQLLYGSETDSATIELIEESLRQHVSFSGELKKYKKDHTPFWSHITITPIINDGSTEKYIYVLSDITEKKLAEERMMESYRDLERINKELDKFAYIVSHDLKAPLRAISNLIAWIEEESADVLNEESKGHFEMIKGRVIRMEALINGILDYSKADRVKSNIVSVDINELINDIYQFNLARDQKDISLKITKTLPVIDSDKVKMNQLFTNLLSNACKHNDKEEIKITIDYLEREQEYEFIVSDNGPGIDRMYHDRIFVIFQTLQARDTFESTGVGLAVVKKIVEDAGGKIWVESEIGQGAAFHFTWPKTIKVSLLKSLQQKPINKTA